MGEVTPCHRHPRYSNFFHMTTDWPGEWEARAEMGRRICWQGARLGHSLTHASGIAVAIDLA